MELTFPPDQSLERNINEAEQHKGNPFWFYQQVRQDGPWDYKQRDLKQYQNFGNFNYGATGAAAGYPDYLLQNAAGAYQLLTRPKLSQGIPLIKAPYGDQPEDYDMINNGILHYKQNFK